MQRPHRTPAAAFISERPTEIFIEAVVDPDDPNDPVFVEFVDEGVPSEAPDFLARKSEVVVGVPLLQFGSTDIERDAVFLVGIDVAHRSNAKRLPLGVKHRNTLFPPMSGGGGDSWFNDRIALGGLTRVAHWRTF